jgi:lipopolysaccharide/colanic/teichoic acid biosynthesis glycosyltransferase
MSIVGPRPALPEHLQRYTCAQRGRLAMRPGVTGLAQINGRNTLKWSRRIEYDLEYIRTFSLLQDLMILIKTVKVVLLREGVAADRNPEQVDDLASPRR